MPEYEVVRVQDQTSNDGDENQQPETLQPDAVKNPAQVKGGLAGSKARMESTTPEQRKAQARKAVETRWAKAKQGGSVPKASHGSIDTPLKIGDVEIQCYVLNDDRRVIVQTSLIEALGMAKGSGSGREEHGDRIGVFLGSKSINPFVPKELSTGIKTPIIFSVKAGPGTSLAYGYEATVIADICEAVIRCRAEGRLNHQQEHIARRCEVLLMGFAKTGIISLIDEATGYQYHRDQQGLRKIMEAFVQVDLSPWEPTYPRWYYDEISRLNRWKINPLSSQRSQAFAQITNELIYERIAPGVYEELNRVCPRDEKGRLKHKKFQRLSDGLGKMQLVSILAKLQTIMGQSGDWKTFRSKLLADPSLPRYGNTLGLPFKDYEPDEIRAD